MPNELTKEELRYYRIFFVEISKKEIFKIEQKGF